jgi:hypothetical protein
MKTKVNKEGPHSMKALPTKARNTGLPARSPAGHRPKIGGALGKIIETDKDIKEDNK